MANLTKFKAVNLWIIRAGIFVVPFIPLYVSRSLFFPYITGKAFIFRTIVEIIFAAWVILAFAYPEYRPKKTPIFWAVLIFVGVVSVATFLGVNPVKSFWSNFERMEGLVTYLHLFVYFLVIGSVFKKRDWLIFLNLFVVSGIFENIYVLFQRLGYLVSPQGGIRTDGTIGNPTYLAAYLIFILAFCALLWLQTNVRWQKYFYGFVFLFTASSIYFTASRGPTLGILVGLIAALTIYLWLKKQFNKKALLVLTFLIAVPLILWLLKDTSFVRNSSTLNRLTSLSFTERTITSRFTIWGMSFQGFKEHPLLGWGPENYPIVFAKYFKPELWNQEPWFDRSHNIVLDWLINAGILGLLSYLTIFVAAFYLLFKRYQHQEFSLELTVLIIATFIAYFFQNLFVFDNLATYIGFFSLLAFISGSAGQTEVGRLDKSLPKIPSHFIAAVGGLAIAVLLSTVYFVNWKPLQANLNLLNSIKVQNQNYSQAWDFFEKALAYNTLGNQEIREQLTRFALSVGALQNVDVDFKDKVLRRAILEAQKSVAENPLDVRPILFLAFIYDRVGLTDEALKLYGKAIELSPQKQQIYFELGDLYIRKNDYKKAIEVLNTAFLSDTTNGFARVNLAAAYILDGQQEKADQLLLEGFGTVNVTGVTPQTLISVYSKVKKYDRLAGMWRALAESDPTNIDYWKNLTGAYLLAGNNSEAIKTLEEAIRINPSFQQEGRAYIKEILSK
jgi:O-antigen ligase/cytochrome c-type biogenesis protein CcmH/NrfG